MLARNAFRRDPQEQNRKHLLKVDKESLYGQDRISSDTVSRNTSNEQNDVLYVLAQEWAERKFARTKYLEFEKCSAKYVINKTTKITLKDTAKNSELEVEF